MKPRYSQYKANSINWINSTREKFDCDLNPFPVKTYELLLFILCCFAYPLFRIIQIHEFTAWQKVYPLNDKTFWILFWSCIIHAPILIYLTLKYYSSNVVLQIWLFGVIICIPHILKDIDHNILLSVNLITMLMFFVYFFAVDHIQLDSLKMLIYTNLKQDIHSGRIYRTPQSKVSWTKIGNWFLWAMGIMASAMFLSAIINLIIKSVQQSTDPSHKPSQPKNQEKIEQQSKQKPLGTFIIVVLFAPIIEEWLFRRFIMKSLGFKWWSILISGLSFGLVHVHEGEKLLNIFPYMIPGIVFAGSMFISKNIWHPTLAHSIYNLTVMMHLIVKEASLG